MTEANMGKTLMLELNKLVSCDTDETTEEQQCFSHHNEAASDDIPPSLLNYFETSKSRAAVCEKLIFEDLEDFPALNLPTEFSEDEKLNEQVLCETENEENQTDVDLLNKLNDEDEAGTEEYMETVGDLALKVSEYRAEQEKCQSEEMQKEEQRKQREMDFQEELRRIMEAEKLQQIELELIEKRAQEKLEQELLLQQELISNLQKQVEQERKRINEEQKRKEEEEEKKMKEREEEDEKKRKEMDERRKREDERKMKEMEEKKKRAEDLRQRKEMEEKREREEEEERKIQEERKRTEVKKVEEERKIMELRLKEEQDRRKKQEEKMRLEEEEMKNMEERNLKEMQTNITELAGKTGEEKNEEEIQLKDELMKTKEGEVRKEDKRQEEKVQVNMTNKNEEEGEEEEVSEMMDDQKQCKKKENRTSENEIQLGKREGKRKTREHIVVMENKDVNREREMKTNEDEQIEEEYRNTEKERSKQEMEGNTSVDERRTKDKDKKQKEVKKYDTDDDTEKKEDREAVRENREGGDNKRKQDTKDEKELPPLMMRGLQDKNKEKTISTEHTKQGHSSARDTLPTSTPSSSEHEASMIKTMDHRDPPVTSRSSPLCLPEHTEQKRLSWMRDCMSWSNLSLHNRRRQRGDVTSRRGLRRAADSSSLPPLCPDTLLQATDCKSLQEITTVTLEDLPGCSLSTLAQCSRLQSLTLRRCGLKSLESINQLQELCYIDLQENNISFMDCENMKSLRVLRLSHNKLTSIHGLNGADNLDVLELSHNSITRIAGLESMKRLQRLSLDHNQLISTKGLRDIYTLLYLDCSHNHLASVDGLENNALLHTLNLTANSLSEPPGLNNQVLLRELHLDDNNIASLLDLTACWLPLMQHLTVAQNRITQLPSMSDFVSLENLDLSFNCLSELHNVCENLEGCQFLRDVRLTENPLQKETGWRSTLQKALPGLRAIDGQQTDSFLEPPAVQQVSLASGCFLTFCQAQLQQTRDLQQHHSRELSNASSPFDAVKSFCRHLTMSLKLAEEQRFAHEYGDTATSDRHKAADQSTCALALDVDALTLSSSGNNMRRRDRSLEGTPVAEMGPMSERKMTPFSLEKAPVSSCGVLHLKSIAAVMIQQQWRKYKQKCGNTNAPSIVEKGGERGGDGSQPESGPSYINRSVPGQDSAATVIQAVWRGFALRRRLASALAAVTQPDAEEDDTFEVVDMDEFVFDEAALEKHWTLTLPEDSPPRYYPVSQQPLSLKPPGPCQDPTQCILPHPRVWSPKQAWVATEQVASAAQRIPPESYNRSKSPPSPSVFSGLSERSERIVEEWGFTDSHTALLMLKRARKMKSKKHQERKLMDPSVHLALFRNCNYKLGPVEAQIRPTPHRNDVKDGEAALGLWQAEKMEQMKVKQWLQNQSAQSEKLNIRSKSEHFLPAISSSILNGGRVQLVADPAYTDRLHHASGLWANSSTAAQPCKPSSYPRSKSLSHARIEAPCPKRVASAPSKKERISFRDNPVKLSGGWGGGKKRDKVHK